MLQMFRGTLKDHLHIHGTILTKSCMITPMKNRHFTNHQAINMEHVHDLHGILKAFFNNSNYLSGITVAEVNNFNFEMIKIAKMADSTIIPDPRA